MLTDHSSSNIKTFKCELKEVFALSFHSVFSEPLQALQHKQPLTSVPDIFQHDGILVTPSLLGSRQSSDESIVGFELHAGMEKLESL